MTNQPNQDLERQIERIHYFENRFGTPASGNWYGMGIWLKRYLGVPGFVPLLVHMDHGVYMSDEPLKTDFLADKPIFVTRKGQQQAIRDLYNKAAYVMGSPFVYCRRLRKIETNRSACGTVAFPVHSTELIETDTDWGNYAFKLVQLPGDFQPVTVCLYWKDLLDPEVVKIFHDAGIRVTTAGHTGDPEFTTAFYEILRANTYSTSNFVSSYSFYSVEMGIPFFLYGDSPEFVNWGGDPNRKIGTFNLEDEPARRNVNTLFTFDDPRNVRITDVCRAKCIKMLGLEDKVDKRLLKRVIYGQYRSELRRRYVSIPVKFLLATCVPSGLRSGYQSLVSREKKELARLRKLERYENTTTDVLGQELSIIDAPSFIYMYDQIFRSQAYRFISRRKTPFIIDGGANIGLSVIYFKRLYPNSEIVAFEPDPEVYNVLRRNCESFRIDDVNLENQALWVTAGTTPFYQEGADAGYLLTGTSNRQVTAINVPTTRLRDLLDRPVDLLKLDVEGAEVELLRDCSDKLHVVENLFIEYHLGTNSNNSISELLGYLEGAGFKFQIRGPDCPKQPFVHRPRASHNFDLLVEIFAYRT